MPHSARGSRCEPLMGTIADRLHASVSTRPCGRGLATAAFDGFTLGLDDGYGQVPFPARHRSA